MNSIKKIKIFFWVCFFLPGMCSAARLSGGGGGSSDPISLSTVTAGATNYIFNQNTLQSGATFYVSSGTIQGQFSVDSFPSSGAGSLTTTSKLNLSGNSFSEGSVWLFDNGANTAEPLIIRNRGASETENQYWKMADGSTKIALEVGNEGGVLMSLTGGTTVFTIPHLNCTGNTNGGALTGDASGNITCSDDNSGGYAVEPATVAFQLDQGMDSSTGTFTSWLTVNSTLTVSGGTVSINGIPYRFPNTTGSNGQVLHIGAVAAGIYPLTWDTDDTGSGGATIWVQDDGVAVDNAVSSVTVDGVLKSTQVVSGKVSIYLNFNTAEFSNTASTFTVNWSSAISRSDAATLYQPLDATLTDLAVAPLTEDNSIDVGAIAAGTLPTDVLTGNNTVDLGTDTTGAYISSINATAPITVTANGAETAAVTIALTQNAGTDVTADLEEETHQSEHQLGAADVITGVMYTGSTDTVSGAKVFISSVAIPQSASPPISAVGQIGFDTTDGVLVIHDGGTSRVFADDIITFGVSISTRSDGWANDQIPISFGPFDYAITIGTITACTFSTSASTLTFNVEERAETALNSAGTDILTVANSTANTTCATYNSFANANIAAGAHLVVDMDTAPETGTVQYLLLRFKGRRDQE